MHPHLDMLSLGSYTLIEVPSHSYEASVTKWLGVRITPQIAQTNVSSNIATQEFDWA